MVLVGLLTLLGLGGAQLSTPVDDWLGRAPKTLEQVVAVSRRSPRPMEQVNRAAKQVQDVTSPSASAGTQEVVDSPAALVSASSSTAPPPPVILIGLAETLLLLYSCLLRETCSFSRSSESAPCPPWGTRKRRWRSLGRPSRPSPPILGTLFMPYVGLGLVVTLVMWAVGNAQSGALGCGGSAVEFIPYIGALSQWSRS